MVNAGLGIAELLDPTRKETNHAEVELMYLEIVTTILQAEAAHEGMDATFFNDELQRRCAETRLTEPAISEEDRDELRPRFTLRQPSRAPKAGSAANRKVPKGRDTARRGSTLWVDVLKAPQDYAGKRRVLPLGP